MQSIVRWLAVVVAWSGSTLLADEVWTYKFIVNGSRPVRLESEMGVTMFADVAGSFSFLMNWENGTGRPLQFNDHLTNLAYGTYSMSTGWVQTPANEPERNTGIFLGFEPPEFQNGNFVPTDGTHWEIATGGFFPFWSIKFTRTNAWLSVEVPIDDAPVHIINASAVFDSATIAGDYNGDLRADARDYVTLRNSGRSQFDFNLWRSYFGTSLSTGGAAASGAGVPEPLAGLLCGNAAGVLLSFRRRRTA